MKYLYISIVGSHAWNMARADSDWDYVEIYQAPSREFLLGRSHMGGHQGHGLAFDGRPYDRASFEIGHHIHQLMKGNVNHVVALFAPSVASVGNVWPAAHVPIKVALREIFTRTLAKNIYHSIQGMTTANLKKYFVPGRESYLPDTPQFQPVRAKKIGQLLRVIQFGVHALGGRLELAPVDEFTGDRKDLERVKIWEGMLVDAYKASSLPEKPDAAPYEEFLLSLRVEELNENM